MKGLQNGIPFAVLAAMASAQGISGPHGMDRGNDAALSYSNDLYNEVNAYAKDDHSTDVETNTNILVSPPNGMPHGGQRGREGVLHEPRGQPEAAGISGPGGADVGSSVSWEEEASAHTEVRSKKVDNHHVEINEKEDVTIVSAPNPPTGHHSHEDKDQGEGHESSSEDPEQGDHEETNQDSQNGGQGDSTGGEEQDAEGEQQEGQEEHEGSEGAGQDGEEARQHHPRGLSHARRALIDGPGGVDIGNAASFSSENEYSSEINVANLDDHSLDVDENTDIVAAAPNGHGPRGSDHRRRDAHTRRQFPSLIKGPHVVDVGNEADASFKNGFKSNVNSYNKDNHGVDIDKTAHIVKFLPPPPHAGYSHGPEHGHERRDLDGKRPDVSLIKGPHGVDVGNGAAYSSKNQYSSQVNDYNGDDHSVDVKKATDIKVLLPHQPRTHGNERRQQRGPSALIDGPHTFDTGNAAGFASKNAYSSQVSSFNEDDHSVDVNEATHIKVLPPLHHGPHGDEGRRGPGKRAYRPDAVLIDGPGGVDIGNSFDHEQENAVEIQTNQANTDNHSLKYNSEVDETIIPPPHPEHHKGDDHSDGPPHPEQHGQDGPRPENTKVDKPVSTPPSPEHHETEGPRPENHEVEKPTGAPSPENHPVDAPHPPPHQDEKPSAPPSSPQNHESEKPSAAPSSTQNHEVEKPTPAPSPTQNHEAEKPSSPPQSHEAAKPSAAPSSTQNHEVEKPSAAPSPSQSHEVQKPVAVPSSSQNHAAEKPTPVPSPQHHQDENPIAVPSTPLNHEIGKPTGAPSSPQSHEVDEPRPQPHQDEKPTGASSSSPQNPQVDEPRPENHQDEKPVPVPSTPQNHEVGKPTGAPSSPQSHEVDEPRPEPHQDEKPTGVSPAPQNNDVDQPIIAPPHPEQHGEKPVPTCSTVTHEVVHTVIRTVEPHPEPTPAPQHQEPVKAPAPHEEEQQPPLARPGHGEEDHQSAPPAGPQHQEPVKAPAPHGEEGPESPPACPPHKGEDHYHEPIPGPHPQQDATHPSPHDEDGHESSPVHPGHRGDDHYHEPIPGPHPKQDVNHPAPHHEEEQEASPDSPRHGGEEHQPTNDEGSHHAQPSYSAQAQDAPAPAASQVYGPAEPVAHADASFDVPSSTTLAHIALSSNSHVPVPPSNAHMVMTSTLTVPYHPSSLNKIPVSVPMSSSSCVYPSNSPASTPSPHVPVGVDAEHSSHPVQGEATPSPSSDGVMFTGSATHLSPGAGAISLLCGVVGFLAFVL